MQDTTIQLPFAVWDLVVGTLEGMQMAAGALWGGLDTFGRFMVVLFIVLWLVLPSSTQTAPARHVRRYRRPRCRWDD